MAKICCLHFRDCVRGQEANPTGVPLPGSTSPSPSLDGIVWVKEEGGGDLGKGGGDSEGRGGPGGACSLIRVCFFLSFFLFFFFPGLFAFSRDTPAAYGDFQARGLTGLHQSHRNKGFEKFLTH